MARSASRSVLVLTTLAPAIRACSRPHHAFVPPRHPLLSLPIPHAWGAAGLMGATAAAARALMVAIAVLAGCASGPKSGPRGCTQSGTPSERPVGKDGPEARPPSGLDKVPDAVPRIEPLRTGGPNKPYRVLGRNYTPMSEDLPLQETGLASWYGRKFHGQPTSNGEIYDMYAMTAAHKTMPLPSYARVRNPANGREIVVRVNDRGPFADARVIDLSYTAALKLGVLAGVAQVQVQRLTFDDIRNGRWRVPGNPTALDAAAERLLQQNELDALVLERSAPH